MLFIPKIIYKAYVPNTNTGYISEKFFNDKILMVIHILRVIAHDQRSKHNHLYNSEYLSIMSSRSPMKSLKVVHCDIQQTLSIRGNTKSARQGHSTDTTHILTFFTAGSP